jgi:GNAT superfamily N-acetyltransferase
MVPFQAPVARTLIVAALADLGERYGGSGDDTPIDPAQFDPPHGVFLVAWLDGSPVGCGGWRSFADTTDLAELKRMYVTPAARGRGVATALLRAIEESARQQGRKRVILETGERQPEAIALYEKAGYVWIENFGHYKDEPGVRSFGRDL